MASIRMDVMTPERAVVRDLEVDSVVLPGTNGQLTVLPGHVSLLTTLSPGSFAYSKEGSWQWAVLSGGFAEVVADKVIVLAETMEMAKEIDVARVELALKRAVEGMKKHAFGTDAYKDAAAAKARAEARLQAANKSH